MFPEGVLGAVTCVPDLHPNAIESIVLKITYNVTFKNTLQSSYLPVNFTHTLLLSPVDMSPTLGSL